MRSTVENSAIFHSLLAHNLAMNTYTKLQSGEWGVLCDARPDVGDTITVTKKDGTTKTETVAQVFTRGEKFVCAVKTTRGGACENCGRHSNQLVTRRDSSGIAGSVCPSCARLAEYELSFA